MPEGSVITAAANRMRNIDRRGLLRPMTTNQIIDLGLRVYRRLAWPLVNSSAMPAVLAYVGVVQITTFVLPGLFTTHHPGDATAQLLELAMALAIAVFVAIPLIVIGLAWPISYSSILAAAYVRGDTVEPAQARVQAMSKMGNMVMLSLPAMFFGLLPLAGSLVLMGTSSLLEAQYGQDSWVVGLSTVLVIIGFIASIFTVPIAISSISVAAPTLANEPVTWREAMKRSRFLKKNYPIHGGTGATVISLFFVCLIAFAAVDAAFSVAVQLLESVPGISALMAMKGFGTIFGGMLESIPTYLTFLFLVPFFTCTCTVLYLERRVRIEALDIELLSEDIRSARRHATPMA